MGFDVPGFHIDDDSPEGRALERIIAREGVTPEEALRRILQRSEMLTAAEEAIGAFSAPKDRVILEQSIAWVRESDHRWEPYDLGL